jgi:hypothetical protein
MRNSKAQRWSKASRTTNQREATIPGPGAYEQIGQTSNPNNFAS